MAVHKEVGRVLDNFSSLTRCGVGRGWGLGTKWKVTAHEAVGRNLGNFPFPLTRLQEKISGFVTAGIRWIHNKTAAGYTFGGLI